ncbi:MAG: GIY-YIG nuclease family protein [Gammaproteobacteria bacterium]|nr:GIY-YIG nuclease family protein [Gammaproteobacteria bacterium]
MLNKPLSCWYVYIIRASDNSLYTGITTDIERRFKQHKEKKGARFFWARDPVEVVFTEEFNSRSDASKREAAIKKLSKVQKEALL